MLIVSACWVLQGRADCPVFSAHDKSAGYTVAFNACTQNKSCYLPPTPEQVLYDEFSKLCTSYYHQWAASPPDQISTVLTQRCRELNQLAKLWCDSIYAYLGRHLGRYSDLPPLKQVMFAAFSQELATGKNIAMLGTDVIASLNLARHQQWGATAAEDCSGPDAAAAEGCSGSEAHPVQTHVRLLRDAVGVLVDIGRQYTKSISSAKIACTPKVRQFFYRVQYSLDMFNKVFPTHGKPFSKRMHLCK